MKKIVLLLITVISLLILSSCSSTEEMNYFNQAFKYHNLEITVNAVDENIQDDGSFLTTISFLAKNTGKSEYD